MSTQFGIRIPSFVSPSTIKGDEWHTAGVGRVRVVFRVVLKGRASRLRVVLKGRALVDISFVIT